MWQRSQRASPGNSDYDENPYLRTGRSAGNLAAPGRCPNSAQNLRRAYMRFAGIQRLHCRPSSRNQAWDHVRLPRGFVFGFLVSSVHGE